MNGKVKKYDKNNKLLSELYYINGKAEGKGIIYTKDGGFIIIESKNDKIINGNYTLYDKNGNFVENFEYKN